MYTGIPAPNSRPSFENVVEAVHRVRSRMRPYDFNTRLEHFAYAWLENHHELINLSRTQAQRATLSEHGFGQLCSRVAPSKNFAAYMRACPPKLRVLNINHWLHQGDDSRDVLFRMQNSEMPNIRAVLSPRYEPFDDVELVDALQRVPQVNDARVQWMTITDKSTHIRLTWPEKREELKKGDIVERGVHISNSEVGCRSVRIQPLVFRLVCTNGMLGKQKAGDAYYFRHIGKRSLGDAVSQAVESAYNHTEHLVTRFRQSLSEAISSPVDELASLVTAGNLTKNHIESILKTFREEGGETKFAMTNALTATARDEKEPIRKTEIEELAGGYLSGMALPASKQVVKERVRKISEGGSHDSRNSIVIGY